LFADEKSSCGLIRISGIMAFTASLVLFGVYSAKSDLWQQWQPSLAPKVDSALRRAPIAEAPAGSDVDVQAAANYTGRYIFVDLGANRADSLWVFLRRPGSKFVFNFSTPDDGRQPEDAEIFLFEANPLFNMDLVNAREKCAKEGINVQVYPARPVHTEDSVVDFYVDDKNWNVDFWASSMNPESDGVRDNFHKMRLTGVNMANFLLERFLPEDFVVVKMDIESTEYQLIPHLAAHSVGHIIDYMYVEWHDWFGSVSNESRVDAAAAKTALEAMGTIFPDYNSPAKRL